MGKFVDLTGKQFNSWKVLSHTDGRYWRCLCTDCNKTVKDIHASSLKSGASKSCGCKNRNKVRDDITGKQFGNWKVLYHIGDGYWMCECQCSNKTRKPVKRVNLLLGKTQSCGCLKREKMRNTLLERYGETCSIKVRAPREKWQIDVLEDKDKLKEYIVNNFNKKPTFYILADKLGVNRHTVSYKVHSLGLEEYIDIDPLVSFEETELKEYIEEIYKGEIIHNSKEIIKPYEIDIYLPNERIAIEFNGSYWHSDINVDKKYHQKKTIYCLKKDIRLIHIFEYEWKKNKDKIKAYLKDIISTEKEIIYARKTKIKTIDKDTEKKFLEENHLQGYAQSLYNEALYFDDRLVGLITIGNPRFNNEYQYEIIRLCFKSNVLVIGGVEKLIKNTINKYKVESLLTYVNLAKFDGQSYFKAGFKQLNNSITEPNYVWYENCRHIVLQRYQTQKKKLIEAGLGTEDETEDDIMRGLGFLKIYDSGNLKLVWKQY